MGFSGDWAIVGAGLTAIPEYEGAKQLEFLPAPGAIGNVGGVGFRIIGTDAGIDLFTPRIGKHWSLTLGPTASYGSNRTHLSTITDLRVRALGRVKPSLELGGAIGVVGNGVLTSGYDRLSVSVTYSHDVTGAYDGDTWRPSVSYLMPVSPRAAFLLLAQADHADSRYARTYFGVTPAQSSASTLPAFTARGGWKDWTLALAGDVSLTGGLTHGLSLVGGVSYTRLINDFAASPVTSIAGSPNQWMAGLGLAYAF